MRFHSDAQRKAMFASMGRPSQFATVIASRSQPAVFERLNLTPSLQPDVRSQFSILDDEDPAINYQLEVLQMRRRAAEEEAERTRQATPEKAGRLTATAVGAGTGAALGAGVGKLVSFVPGPFDDMVIIPKTASMGARMGAGLGSVWGAL